MKTTIFKIIIFWCIAAIFLIQCGQDMSKNPGKEGKSENIKAIKKNNSIVQPVIELDRGMVLNKKEEQIFILIGFEIPEIKQEESSPRPNINMGIVLDRSGSMSNKGKIEYAKKAAKFVVDNLEATDRLAIVEYDNQISVLWPSVLVTSKEMIKKRIEELTPRGSTNLTGGMMKGVEEIQNHFKLDWLNRVILLSDGLANAGIVNPIEIKALVQNTKRKGITISTMGLGLDYNEDLMQTIAENGGGNYYYIESPTQMKRIFQEELSTLFTTVAKDVKVKFKGSGIVKNVTAYGYQFETFENITTIQIENLFAGEKRSLLLRLNIFAGEKGKQNLGEVEVNFFDSVQNKKQVSAYQLFVSSSENNEKVQASQNKQVMAEATLIEADDQHEQFIKQYEKGKKDEAKKNITELVKNLEAKNKNLKDIKLAKKVEALKMESKEMEEADKNVASRQSYLKKSKQAFYYAKKGKRGKYLMLKGDKGYDVERLQKKLIELKLYSGPLDGVFSDEVEAALKKFQQRQGLKPDGVAGPETLKRLGLY